MNCREMRDIALRVGSFVKKNYIWFLFVFLTVYALGLRISNVSDFPEANDFQRDYFIAHHIAAFGDFPKEGPHNTVFGKTVLPFYYFAASIPVFLYDSPVALSLANILMHLAIGALIFFAAKKAFDDKTALVSYLIWCSSFVMLQQATLFSQAQVAAMFVSLGYYSLLRAYINPESRWIFVAIPFFVGAALFHSSVFALIPGVAFCTFFILKKRGAVSAIPWLAAGGLILSICYRPLLDVDLTFFFSKFARGSEIMVNFISNTIDLLGSFFGLTEGYTQSLFSSSQFSIGEAELSFDWIGANPVAIAIALLFIGTVVLYLLSPDIAWSRKRYVASGLVIFGFYLLVMSTVRVHEKTSYNLLPLYIILLFIVAECTNVIPWRGGFKVMRIFVVLCFVFALSQQSSLLVKPSFSFRIFQYDQVVSVLAKAEALGMSGAKGVDAIEYVRMGDDAWRRSSSVLWNALEKKYGQLAKITDANKGMFSPLRPPTLIFWLCPIRFQDECLGSFSEELTIHDNLQKVFVGDRFSIFVVEKNETP